MNEHQARAERVIELLADATELESSAREMQAERPSTWSEDQTRAFRQRYQDWYGTALVVLPDDLKAQFAAEFTGSRFSTGIEKFISNPTQPNIIFAQAALENPDAISSLYWQYPVEVSFEQRFIKQQALLRQAKERYTFLSTIPDTPIFGLLAGGVEASQVMASGSVETLSPKVDNTASQSQVVVFIAHGQSPIYLKVYHYLKDDLGLEAVAFETEDHTSEQVSEILSQYLDRATAAVIVMTGEDKTIENRLLARQNVVHEAGLFQAKLGFERVALLREKGVENFSNAQGLIYIPFDPQNIKSCFYDLRRFLVKLRLVSN